MKFTHLLATLGIIPSTLADINSSLPRVDLLWMGSLTPGGSNMTLNGTAQSIYEQIVKLNPAYDASEHTEFAARSTELDVSHAKRSGTVNCNAGTWVDFNANCQEGLNYLRNLGGWCYTPPGSFARVSCSRGCGFYFCDTSGGGQWGLCANIAGDMSLISGACWATFTPSNGPCNPTGPGIVGGVRSNSCTTGTTRRESRGVYVWPGHYTLLSRATC